MRRLGGAWLAFVALAGWSNALTSAAVAAAEPPPWVIDYDASHVRFAAGLFGSKIRGRFGRFRAEIRLDPERLSASRFVVSVDASSIDTRNSERDAELLESDWFHVSAFPEIRFESETIERGADGYRTRGTLSMIGVDRTRTFPFELEVREDPERGRIGIVRGRATLERTEFGLGKGRWGKTSVVRDAVDVEVELRGVIPRS